MSIKEFAKNHLPQSIREKVIDHNAEKNFKILKKNVENMRDGKGIIFLLATPNHGNVGDQAIAFAERRFLEEELSNFHIVEIMFNEYVRWKEKLETVIKEEDIICYHGGGNMGTQYFECETEFRDMIQRFDQNRIITFPQTIFYGKDERSQKEFECSKDIYGAHSKLILVAREHYSYEVMKEAYGATNKVIMVPDIVLYLQPEKGTKKEGALVCLRNDVERSLSKEDHEYIFRKLREHFGTVVQSDTIVDIDYVSREAREGIVRSKLEEFRNAELVVTDRLHGMVFSYLSDTPCLVLSNYNYKVAGVYEWIKKSKKILFLQDVKKFEESLAQLERNAGEPVMGKDAFAELKRLFVECD